MRSREYPLCGRRVYRTRLSCGLSLLVIPQPGFSRRFAALAVRCGSTDTAWKLGDARFEAPSGTAHFLEHTLFEMPWGSAMDRLSAMGASANAFTGPFETVYHISCADGFEDALKCLLEFVTEPWFPEKIVLREQGIITQEIGMLADRPEYAVH